MNERPGQVVAADLEGTLTAAETWRAVADHLFAGPGRWRYRLFVLGRLPRVMAARLGLLERQDFRDRWLAGLAGQLAGMPADDFAVLADLIVEQHLWPNRRREVIEELEQHRAAGRRLILCSGSYQPVLDSFASRLGAEALGTALESHSGSLTGRLVEPPNTGARKAARLRAVLNGQSLHTAYGDSLADVEMLADSRLAVVIHPEPGLHHVAVERGWRIVLG